MPAHRGATRKSEGRVLVRAAGLAAPPSKCARIAAEQAFCFDLRLADRSRALGVGRNIERIGRAIDFAQKAGLAVVLASDHGRRFGPGVEDVGRADSDADVALDAAAGGDDFNHAAALQDRARRSTTTLFKPAGLEQANKSRVAGGPVAPAVHAAAFRPRQSTAICPATRRDEGGCFTRLDGLGAGPAHMVANQPPARIQATER